ncbi:hypothetical protein RND71_021545 [Anisodus tanguticus]|uniref:Uncharacterized protein n=1 Tax=Anisodus tanguticus TaxID=243964 RepID=A0AAE1RYL3_9SOLA|nr:hypothetical protein RND71_021545 [Anisodus tanguticus]
MCGHTMRDTIRNDDIQDKIRVALVEDKMRKVRLRWFGPVQRRHTNAQYGGVRGWLWTGFKRGEGRPKKYREEVIKRDMMHVQLTEEMTLDMRCRSQERNSSCHTKCYNCNASNECRKLCGCWKLNGYKNIVYWCVLTSCHYEEGNLKTELFGMTKSLATKVRCYSLRRLQLTSSLSCVTVIGIGTFVGVQCYLPLTSKQQLASNHCLLYKVNFKRDELS